MRFKVGDIIHIPHEPGHLVKITGPNSSIALAWSKGNGIESGQFLHLGLNYSWRGWELCEVSKVTNILEKYND
jgi:hypothetical protein